MQQIFYTKDGWLCERYPTDFPKENSYIEVDDEIYEQTLVVPVGMHWRYKNGTLEMVIYDQEEFDKSHIEGLRRIRQTDFAAFDIYKTNYILKLENVSDTEHASIIEWYNKCLNLDEDAILNPPARIVKYFEKE